MLRIPRFSFEESPVSHEEMQSRIKQRAPYLPWFPGIRVEKYSLMLMPALGALEVRIDTRQSTVYVHNAYLQRGLGVALSKLDRESTHGSHT